MLRSYTPRYFKSSIQKRTASPVPSTHPRLQLHGRVLSRAGPLAAQGPGCGVRGGGLLPWHTSPMQGPLLAERPALRCDRLGLLLLFLSGGGGALLVVVVELVVVVPHSHPHPEPNSIILI